MTNDDGTHTAVIAAHVCSRDRNRAGTAGGDIEGMRCTSARSTESEMNRRPLFAALTAGLLCTVLGAGEPAEAASRRVVRGNDDGAVTASTATARRGPAGGAALRGRAVKTDGQGAATAVSGAVVRGPNGAVGARAGKTAVNADGSATHASGFAAQDSKGSVASKGSASRDAAGGVSQTRTTTATSATTGNSATTTSSYGSGSGRTRSTSCYDASGGAIACPGKP